MTTTKLDPIPLVGARFRPPASLVLSHLPGGCELELRPEPDNPYDPLAIQVWVRLTLIPATEYLALASELLAARSVLTTPIAAGWDLDSLLESSEIQLGFLCSSTNQHQLSKAPPGESWGHNGLTTIWPPTAKLGWSGNGQALVLVTLDGSQT